jgi:hypothetical protein
MHPRRPDEDTFLALQCIGKIDDAGPGKRSVLPVRERCIGMPGKKSKIGTQKGAGADGLNKRDFIADGLQLAECLAIVQKDEIGSRKGAGCQGVIEFFAAERCGSHDSDTVIVIHEGFRALTWSELAVVMEKG